MSNYSQKFNKFDLAREVLANRYMLTTLLVNINNLVYFLEGKEKALRELLPEDKRKALHKVIKFRDADEKECSVCHSFQRAGNWCKPCRLAAE